MERLQITFPPFSCNPFLRATPATLTSRQQIQQLCREGPPVYFTQDAEPNLKLIFDASSLDAVKQTFTDLRVVRPFDPA